MTLELRQVVELLADRDLQVVARDRLVERDRLRLGARRARRVGGVDEVGAGTAAVGSGREVVGVRARPRRGSRGSARPGRRAVGSRPNQPGIAAVARATLSRATCQRSRRRPVAQRRVRPEPVEDRSPARRCPTASRPIERELARQLDLAQSSAELVQLGGGAGRRWCAGGSPRRTARRRRAASTTRRARRHGRRAPARRRSTSRYIANAGRMRSRTSSAASARHAVGAVPALGQAVVPGTGRCRPGPRGSRPGCAACARAPTPRACARRPAPARKRSSAWPSRRGTCE